MADINDCPHCRTSHPLDAVCTPATEIEDLYNGSPCGYHSLDGAGVYHRINDTELAWLGYRREELLGKKKFVDLLTPASVLVFNANFALFKERGWVKDLEFELVRKDGSILPRPVERRGGQGRQRRLRRKPLHHLRHHRPPPRRVGLRGAA